MMRCRHLVTAVLVIGVVPVAPVRGAIRGVGGAPMPDVARRHPYFDGRRTVMPHSLAEALADIAHARAAHRAAIPSFSRQTKLACGSCHYQFLALTPFGRRFKLNGYTLSGLENIVGREPTDTIGQTLRLSPIAPLSAMAIVSFSKVKTGVPDKQNNVATFPDQLSIFLGGALAPKAGAFVQFTYAAPDAAIGIDNVDLRIANQTTFASKELIYGVTLHNNPTVQDVWNTVPAWGFPFISSPVAPSPAASSLIDGALGQQVVGLGAYSLWNDLLYTEFTVYRSAPQGGAQPADSSATNTMRNVAPYWRVALEHQLGGTYVMVGTYGMVGTLFPTGIAGLTNRYTDVAADAQLERPVGTGGVVIGRATLIREKQRLDAFVNLAEPAAANVSNTLTTLRANLSYEPSQRYGLTLGYFDVRGTRDTLLYAPAEIEGSATGRPNSSGVIGEVDFNAWQNVRFGAQYVSYGQFNGASRSYDGAGRNAADNNTLYVFTWLAF